MEDKLDARDLRGLIDSVFSLTAEDHHLLFIVDIPDDILPDTEGWRIRRGLAEDWCRQLKGVQDEMGLKSVRLLAYPNVHSNNANLPEWGVYIDSELAGLTAKKLTGRQDKVNLKDAFTDAQLIIAPTQLSTTAPMKLLSRQLNFRAATMPGFTPDMIPALRLDYKEINRRVNLITEEISLAQSLEVHFTVDSTIKHSARFDLRHRQGHSSGGRFPSMGMAGNLPSGESYIVPYEGELDAVSESTGNLPVQFEEEVVVYRIERNKAVEVLTEGSHSAKESQKIIAEPAYANISELGFGVLKDFGLRPTGITLLDEKLGLHIAFGRSDHFGGSIGVKDFSSPEAVVHIDRIYIPETAPRIHVDSVILTYDDLTTKSLMLDGDYTIF